ncbi:MAG: peptidase M23 [Cereibacter sphaeroides]|uniref:Peptidase M23 n=1 Tax=Cereibacter sphaeroides TaxID=1063 RepID=A0A2W5SMU2_CERSP|nr:MAG: peptidase M23 [Cereibacter sphaeroides]
MTQSPAMIRALTLTGAMAALSACATAPGQLDWDLRPNGPGMYSTADAARNATASRPQPDARGVISYPGYQVAVAQRGDTVASVATRVGVSPAELASYNAMAVDAPVNQGAVLALPRRVDSAATPGAAAGAPIQSGTIEVTALASGAIDRAQAQGATGAATPPAAAIQPGGVEPIRHKVARGETAYSVARLYNVSAKSLAEWNGLGPDLAVREGQYLLIPVTLQDRAANAEPVTQPGAGSPTPEPPSAAKPLPQEKVTPAAQPSPDEPASPNLAKTRTEASASKFAMPAQGSIVRGYTPKKSPGINIGAAAGSPVVAAADGTVAAITKDTEQVPILVVRHPDNILTVYANIDGIKVAKGDKIKRGQPIAVVRNGSPAFLHFEVRNGVEAVDPLPYLQ